MGQTFCFKNIENNSIIKLGNPNNTDCRLCLILIFPINSAAHETRSHTKKITL